MSLYFLRFFFCTLGAFHFLGPVACCKRVEPACFVRSRAACLTFFSANTAEAKAMSLFRACCPIALAPDLTKGRIAFLKKQKYYRDRNRAGTPPSEILTVTNLVQIIFFVTSRVAAVHRPHFGGRAIRI